MPFPKDWIYFAKQIVEMHEKQLGPNFRPANMEGASYESGVAITHLRAGLPRGRNAAMLTYLHEVTTAVKRYKTGCCGELTMSAFNRVRLKEPSAQVFQVPGADKDFHAFLIMGACDSFYEPVSIDDIANEWPDAIIVDYWASCHKNTLPGAHGRGIFTVGEYRDKTKDALRVGAYDLSQCRIFTLSGANNVPGMAAVNVPRIRLKY